MSLALSSQGPSGTSASIVFREATMMSVTGCADKGKMIVVRPSPARAAPRSPCSPLTPRPTMLAAGSEKPAASPCIEAGPTPNKTGQRLKEASARVPSDGPADDPAPASLDTPKPKSTRSSRASRGDDATDYRDAANLSGRHCEPVLDPHTSPRSPPKKQKAGTQAIRALVHPSLHFFLSTSRPLPQHLRSFCL